MQLAAAGGFRRIQGFKELHRRCHDHRRVPIFTSQTATKCFLIVRVPTVLIQFRLTMMLQHVFFAQYFSENVRCLLNDAGIWNHINDSFHAVRFGMAQRKGQRRYRFSAARRHSQRIKPLHIRPTA